MSKELQFLIYNTPQEDIKVDVVIKDETIWLTQKTMAEFFGVERSVVTKHLGNIFKEGELEEKSNVQKMHIPHSDKPIKFYNRDATISKMEIVQGGKA